jgi:hypothetical protein
VSNSNQGAVFARVSNSSRSTSTYFFRSLGRRTGASKTSPPSAIFGRLMGRGVSPVQSGGGWRPVK